MCIDGSGAPPRSRGAMPGALLGTLLGATTAAIHHQLLTMNPTTNRALSICYVSQLNW